MGNLANTYSALGRHQDALAMEEKTLEFRAARAAGEPSGHRCDV